MSRSAHIAAQAAFTLLRGTVCDVVAIELAAVMGARTDAKN